MDFDSFLGPADAARAQRTLRKLARHDISEWALTGGLALEFHLIQRHRKPFGRLLNDIDFIAASFNDISGSLGGELLLRHVHPDDPPGKMMLQAVDPETAVRVDVFRAYGLEMDRAIQSEIAGLPFKMASLRDLIARHARLNWDLVTGHPVAPKFARDFLRIVDLLPAGAVQDTWLEHRKPSSPSSFVEVSTRLKETIENNPDLLIPTSYSADVHEICPRCHARDMFQLADA